MPPALPALNSAVQGSNTIASDALQTLALPPEAVASHPRNPEIAWRQQIKMHHYGHTPPVASTASTLVANRGVIDRAAALVATQRWRRVVAAADIVNWAMMNAQSGARTPVRTDAAWISLLSCAIDARSVVLAFACISAKRGPNTEIRAGRKPAPEREVCDWFGCHQRAAS